MKERSISPSMTRESRRDYFHSLLRVEAHRSFTTAQSIAVQCRSLASLAREGLISQEIGVFKTDTEGYDLNVVRGMGDVRAEVLVCEFVTPSLYRTWTGSFPEALIEAAFDRGYEACIAVKRMAGHESSCSTLMDLLTDNGEISCSLAGNSLTALAPRSAGSPTRVKSRWQLPWLRKPSRLRPRRLSFGSWLRPARNALTE